MTKCIAMAVVLLCVLVNSLDAHGLLRRLLCPPRVRCAPLPLAIADVGLRDTLEGRVSFVGELPKLRNLEEVMYAHQDNKHILKGPKADRLDPTWKIDPHTKGVANVCVYLKRPADGRLPIHADDKIRKAPVVLDAPFCVFVPHMVAFYPVWNDGKDIGLTGQKLILRNSAPVPQSVRIIVNPRFNRVDPAISDFVHGRTEFEFTPNVQRLPVVIQSNFHVWMQSYVWVFDHPYFAITKTDGTFFIPRVPAGMEVQVMAWHESQGWLFTSAGKTMTLKQGKNVLDFEISVPK